MLICVILSCRKAGKQNAKGKQEAKGRPGKGIHRESAPCNRVGDEMDQEGRKASAKQEVQPERCTKGQGSWSVRCDDRGCPSRILRTTGPES
jgi:hypothetical protein